MFASGLPVYWAPCVLFQRATAIVYSSISLHPTSTLSPTDNILVKLWGLYNLENTVHSRKVFTCLAPMSLRVLFVDPLKSLRRGLNQIATSCFNYKIM